MSESDNQARILLELGGRSDTRVFRNTVGTGWMGEATHLPDGSVLIRKPRFVTFGLCPGSPDIIGWRTVVVTSAMVGCKVALFLSAEVKSATVKKARDLQLRFINAVNEAGGVAGVVRTPGEANELINSTHTRN